MLLHPWLFTLILHFFLLNLKYVVVSLIQYDSIHNDLLLLLLSKILHFCLIYAQLMFPAINCAVIQSRVHSYSETVHNYFTGTHFSHDSELLFSAT